MNWLDRITMVGLALVIGCSDDGLAPPPADTDGSSAGLTSSATSGADTGGSNGESFTASATAEGTSADPSDSTGNEATGGPADSTGGGTESACFDETECVLVNDCCQCAVVHLDEPVEECPLDCKVPVCDELGIPDIGLLCEEGECAFEERNCSDAFITCDAPTPECPEGTLPEVTEEGDCWTGACIPVDICDGVPSCDFCTEDEVCVETQTEVAPAYECEPIPEECMGTPSCECLPDVCEAPFDVCVDDKGAIACTSR